ncbi:hypothetical protein ACT23D_004637 [Salmonella enterica]|nr:hypothetical protein [Salmonella enterica]EHL4660750.1 hypothetical protein [Salmonella enterica subsp. enterica serovar Miami]EBJ6947402.1 hypothetical protein [Salmonella enterica]EBU2149818.1 hypothetical protein [Salmonella enterica]EHL4691130.1 hypothetical protein [Salmonella enterica subsp. enterica serovar Miami]
MTVSRLISLAAGVSLSVLFSTAAVAVAVADNGRGSGNSNIENQTRIYTGTDRGQKQHREAKGKTITRSVQCSLPAYLRDPDNQC